MVRTWLSIMSYSYCIYKVTLYLTPHLGSSNLGNLPVMSATCTLYIMYDVLYIHGTYVDPYIHNYTCVYIYKHKYLSFLLLHTYIYIYISIYLVGFLSGS